MIVNTTTMPPITHMEISIGVMKRAIDLLRAAAAATSIA